MASLTYRIDSEDRIVFISPGWDNFADENFGQTSKSHNILGKKLWEFIKDPQTSQIYIMLVEKVRKTGEKIKVPFRCDSPEFRRYLFMEIKELEGGIIEFNSILEKVERREKVRLLEEDVERSSDFVKVCSWCKKVYFEQDKKWYEVEDFVQKMNLFSEQILPMLTHTMCDSCFRQLSEET